MKIPKFFRDNDIKLLVLRIRRVGKTRINESSYYVKFKSAIDVDLWQSHFTDNWRYIGGVDSFHNRPQWGPYFSEVPQPVFKIQKWGANNRLIVYIDRLFFCPQRLHYWVDFKKDNLCNETLEAWMDGNLPELFMCVRNILKSGRKEFHIKESDWGCCHKIDFCRVQREHDESERIKKLPPPVECVPEAEPILEDVAYTPPREKPNYVYLMKNRRNGYYKIGRSVSPTVREKTLQAEDPDIKMVFKRVAPIQVERDLHKKYNEKRLRGEWFNLSSFDIKRIVKTLESNG